MPFGSYSSTPSANTSIAGNNISEGGPPSAINNAIRQLMADARLFSDSVPATQVILASATQGVYPNAAGANVPRGLTQASVGAITPGSGGTNGTFNLAWTGGNFTVNPTGTFTVTGGALASVNITGPGQYIGLAANPPTPGFGASLGLSGAAVVLTAQTLVGSGVGYWVVRAGGEWLDRYVNNSGAALATPAVSSIFVGDLSSVNAVAGVLDAVETVAANIAAVIGAPAAAQLAADWAEKATPPGAAGTQSAKTWAKSAQNSAITSSSSSSLALQYRDTTAQLAATAQAAFLTLGQLYQTISSGLAATAPNAYFAVAGTGDVFATVYQKVSGSAVLVNTLASQAALDRVGRFVPNIANIDNSVAINAALAQPLVSGIILPPGNIRVDHAITMTAAMSGKFFRGAGTGATRLIRTDNIGSSEYADKAGVIVRGGIGNTISDFTFVSPLVASKVQGVWFTDSSKFGLCERVEAINTGYSFWAQEFSSFCAFRDVRSINGNVHFETTRATDILFDGMYADDGDGTNPLGTEATWHCLFGSKRITFRNGRHRGKGQPFLLVADAGTGDEGLIDQIRFENCKSQQLDGKIAFFASAFSGTIGRVDVVDCDLDATGGGGIPLQVQLGDFHFKGGNWRGNSQEFCMVVGSTATLEWENPNLYMDPPAEADGYFFSGKSTVRGGRVTTTSQLIDLSRGPDVKAIGDVEFIAPGSKGKAFTPLATQKSGFVFAADRQYAFTETFGMMAGDGRLQLSLADGATYRVRFIGRMKKSASGTRRVGVYIDGLGGTLISGSLAADTASVPAERKVFTISPGGKIVDYAEDMDSAGFELAMVVRGNGGTMTLSAPDGDVILMAGSEFSIERLA